MVEQEMLLQTVSPLSAAVRQVIADFRSRGTLEPEKEAYYSWKVDEFEYTSEGVKNCRRHSELVVKNSWRKASLVVVNAIKESSLYHSAVESLTQLLGDENVAGQATESLISRLVGLHIREQEVTTSTLEELAGFFFKDVLGEPVMNGARVALDGMVILAEKVDFTIGDTHVMLRPVQRHDLEYETPAFTPLPTPREFFGTPTAVLEVEFLGRKVDAIQAKVEQAIAVLRLFKPGSVKYTSYTTWSKSVIGFGAGAVMYAGPFEHAYSKATIGEGDARELKGFWEAVLDRLPPPPYERDSTSFNYRTIAYDRYCDALLQNGIMERRIANAVMGLESIFLRGGETQELLYRLSIRVARIFGLMGLDPHQVRHTLQEAYKIRSLFVHGDKLSYNAKRKLDAKYGSINGFLLTLLDYCRMGILATMLLRKEKDEYVDSIDDALVDMERTEKLERQVQRIRHLIVRGLPNK